MKELNSYDLSRNFFNWCFENPEKVTPTHIAMYFFIIEHCNRLGWKEKFGLPTTMVKDAIGIRNFRTYSNTLNDLVEWGFIKMIEVSKNQYSSNIIAIVNFAKADTKALDKAMQKHSQKQCKSIDSIYKQETSKQGTSEQSEKSKRFLPPTILEVESYCLERNNNVKAENFIDYYTSKGWFIGKSKMKDWKAAIRTWERNDIQPKKEPEQETMPAIIKRTSGGGVSIDFSNYGRPIRK